MEEILHLPFQLHRLRIISNVWKNPNRFDRCRLLCWWVHCTQHYVYLTTRKGMQLPSMTGERVIMSPDFRLMCCLAFVFNWIYANCFVILHNRNHGIVYHCSVQTCYFIISNALSYLSYSGIYTLYIIFYIIKLFNKTLVCASNNRLINKGNMDRW